MTDGTHQTGGRRVGVVVNPERSSEADRLLAQLRAAGADVVLRAPDDPDDLGAALDELVGEHVDVVAALGGDGTQRTAAARLVGTDTPLAVVPGGTVNLLASVLGIDDADAAVQAILDGHTTAIDVGRSGDDVFVLNASLGWDAQVIARVDHRYKRFGRAGFVAAAVLEWRRFRTQQVVVRLDGEEWYRGPALTVIVLNAPERGFAAVELVRAARIDDGRLDVFVVRRRSVLALARSAWTIVRRRQPRRADVRSAQSEHITVEWERDVAVQRDGDADGRTTTFDAVAVPDAIRVIVPTGDEPHALNHT